MVINVVPVSRVPKVSAHGPKLFSSSIAVRIIQNLWQNLLLIRSLLHLQIMKTLP